MAFFYIIYIKIWNQNTKGAHPEWNSWIRQLYIYIYIYSWILMRRLFRNNFISDDRIFSNTRVDVFSFNALFYFTAALLLRFNTALFFRFDTSSLLRFDNTSSPFCFDTSLPLRFDTALFLRFDTSSLLRFNTASLLRFNTASLLRFNTALLLRFNIVLLLRLATLICLQLLHYVNFTYPTVAVLLCDCRFIVAWGVYLHYLDTRTWHYKALYLRTLWSCPLFFAPFHESSLFFFFLVHFLGVHSVFLFIVVLHLFAHNGCFCRLFEDSQESIYHPTESYGRTHRGGDNFGGFSFCC